MKAFLTTILIYCSMVVNAQLKNWTRISGDNTNEWTWMKGDSIVTSCCNIWENKFTWLDGDCSYHFTAATIAPQPLEDGSFKRHSSSWTDNKGEMYVFGGDTNGSNLIFCNSVWKYIDEPACPLVAHKRVKARKVVEPDIWEEESDRYWYKWNDPIRHHSSKDYEGCFYNTPYDRPLIWSSEKYVWGESLGWYTDVVNLDTALLKYNQIIAAHSESARETLRPNRGVLYNNIASNYPADTPNLNVKVIAVSLIVLLALNALCLSCSKQQLHADDPSF